MDEAISQRDKEFGDLIARMRDGGIGLVYFGGYHTEASLFVRQARAGPEGHDDGEPGARPYATSRPSRSSV